MDLEFKATHPYRSHGEQLKRMRKQRRMTQLIVAVKSDVPVSMIQEYEQGRCMPSLDRWLRIIVALKLNQNEIANLVKTNEQRIPVN